jgi:Raf kinase inhibitor-like YbhB/YbcL family protein
VKSLKIFIFPFALVIVFCIVGVIFNINLKQPLSHSPVHPFNQKEGHMKLTTVFEHNSNIPSVYTCDGQDLAPELTISDVPASAKELVLIVDDPDAPMGTWVHWLVYNIPVNTTSIDAKNLPQGIKQGITDFGRIGWGGPCPPSGTHRYFFKLYAIDKVLELPIGAKKAQLVHSIKDHIIEKSELIGLYKRK